MPMYSQSDTGIKPGTSEPRRRCVTLLTATMLSYKPGAPSSGSRETPSKSETTEVPGSVRGTAFMRSESSDRRLCHHRRKRSRQAIRLVSRRRAPLHAGWSKFGHSKRWADTSCGFPPVFRWLPHQDPRALRCGRYPGCQKCDHDGC